MYDKFMTINTRILTSKALKEFTPFSVPVNPINLCIKANVKQETYHASERRKSRQSAKSISSTAGFRSIEFMWRFGRLPLHSQHPCCLRKSGRAMSTRSNDSYASAVKMCTQCSASFSYSLFASRTSRLRMSFLWATTLLTIRERK